MTSRFDRIDDDIFEGEPAPPPEDPSTRFARVEQAFQEVARAIQENGVTVDPAYRQEVLRHRAFMDGALAHLRDTPIAPARVCHQCQGPVSPPYRLCANCDTVQYSEPHTIPTSVTYDLPADPRAWLFAFPASEDGPIVVFTPIAYWRIQRAQIDCHVDHVLRPLFPPNIIGEELSDSTFDSYEPNLGVIRTALTEAGFQHDPAFEAFVNGEH